RHWAEEMGVDGFRFDLASVFARDMHGNVDIGQPALIHEIGAMAAQLDVRLVAEAWDISAYLLGRSFPGLTWRQWNGQFRDELSAFVKGDPGKVGALMARLTAAMIYSPTGPATCTTLIRASIFSQPTTDSASMIWSLITTNTTKPMGIKTPMDATIT